MGDINEIAAGEQAPPAQDQPLDFQPFFLEPDPEMPPPRYLNRKKTCSSSSLHELITQEF